MREMDRVPLTGMEATGEPEPLSADPEGVALRGDELAESSSAMPPTTDGIPNRSPAAFIINRFLRDLRKEMRDQA